MPTGHLWSVVLHQAEGSRLRRNRWLTENGDFSLDPSKALRVVDAQAAALRLQEFVESRGWPLRAMERLRLIPAPPRSSPPVELSTLP